mmetsp:Transcript_86511/g.239891  ORF Transcript_86511/g.239891 Transcript_86511/m.239891 type:complete len:83 (+) Transcript_86511:144-392(+)
MKGEWHLYHWQQFEQRESKGWPSAAWEQVWAEVWQPHHLMACIWTRALHGQGRLEITVALRGTACDYVVVRLESSELSELAI